jgi:hypothetical protein
MLRPDSKHKLFEPFETLVKRGTSEVCSDNWRNQAFSQLCAFSSPFWESMSVMRMLRQYSVQLAVAVFVNASEICGAVLCQVC